MENEELATLRASLLAAERLPQVARARQARLSARLTGSDELLPYVLAESCSDPRDRRVPDMEVRLMRVLEGGADRPIATRPGRQYFEPAPIRPGWLAGMLLAAALLFFVLHLLSAVLLFR